VGIAARIIGAVVFAGFYIATFGPRTGWAGGIVSGLLGGVLVYLLLTEAEKRRRNRRR
jgi:membrane associated rhomboid family serine protease